MPFYVSSVVNQSFLPYSLDQNSGGQCKRGRLKMCAGIDFSDEKGRVVCIVGVPFPPLNDPRIMIKQEYLDSLRMKHKSDPNFKKHTIPSGRS